jgi:hypothetical protein
VRTSAIVAVVEHKWVELVEQEMQEAGADLLTAALSTDIAAQLEAGHDVAYSALSTQEGSAATYQLRRYLDERHSCWDYALVNCRNTIIIITSNIGSRYIVEEPDEARTHEGVMTTLRSHFPPEFLNRVDDIVIFPGWIKKTWRKLPRFSSGPSKNCWAGAMSR